MNFKMLDLDCTKLVMWNPNLIRSDFAQVSFYNHR